MKNAFVTRRHSDDGLKFAAASVITGMPDTKFADFEHAGLVREATDAEVLAAGAAAIAFTTHREEVAEPVKPKAPRKPAAKRKATPKAKATPKPVAPTV